MGDVYEEPRPDRKPIWCHNLSVFPLPLRTVMASSSQVAARRRVCHASPALNVTICHTRPGDFVFDVQWLRGPERKLRCGSGGVIISLDGSSVRIHVRNAQELQRRSENNPVQPDCERPQAVVLRRPRRGPRPLCKPAIETNQHRAKFTIALSSTTTAHSQCTSRQNEKETQPGWAAQNPKLNASRA